MANERTAYLNAIPEGTLIMLRGRLRYSRLAKKIDGDALQKDIERRRKQGQQYIKTVPYTTAQICDVQIIPNPSLPQDVAANVNAYMNLALFQSNAEGSSGYCFRVEHTGALPWVGTRQADGSVEQVSLERELANDQTVTLVLHVYKSQNFANHGLGLTGVIVENPTVQYYSGGLESQLKAAGIIFSKPLVPQESINHPVENASVPTGPEPTMAPPIAPPQEGVDPFTAMPTPAGAANGYAQPQPATPFPQPAQAQAFPMPQPVAQTTPMPNPSGFAGSEGGGIRYDASDRQYH